MLGLELKSNYGRVRFRATIRGRVRVRVGVKIIVRVKVQLW